MKIALRLSYLGSRYHGWQRQNNAMTIQELMEQAIFNITGQRVHVSGCGRTDAGVHARNYVAGLSVDTNIPMERLPVALNSNLPDDIVVHEAQIVPPDFDARFSCRLKEYTYTILNTPQRDPFRGHTVWLYPKPLDVAAMEQAAQYLVGTHDFKALQSAGSPKKSTVRTIYYCNLSKEGDEIHIQVAANGFLYNMVRCIAGTLVYCGIGKLSPQDMPSILSGAKRKQAGPTAPPQGLCMTKASYDIFSN